MKSSILCAGFVLLLAFNIHAQSGARAYAVTFYDRLFITIDTTSGAGTLITNLPSSPADLAASGGKLWLFSAGSTAERLTQLTHGPARFLGRNPSRVQSAAEKARWISRRTERPSRRNRLKGPAHFSAST